MHLSMTRASVVSAMLRRAAVLAALSCAAAGCGGSGGSDAADALCAEFVRAFGECLSPELSIDEETALIRDKCPEALTRIDCDFRGYYQCALSAVFAQGLTCTEAEAASAVAAACGNPCSDLVTVDQSNLLLCPADMSLSFEDLAAANPADDDGPEPFGTPRPDATIVAPTIAPTPATTPTATPAVEQPAPAIGVQPANLMFNHVVTVTSCPQPIGQITITNTGNGPGTFFISVSTQALTASQNQLSLQPGQSQDVQALFTCSQATSFNGQYLISVANGSAPPATVNVTGNVQPPQ